MPNTFFASDHHLGHQAMLNFFKADKVTPLRSFANMDEMNEHIIAQHNAVVKPSDTIWFMGDVVINRRYLWLISRFNGRKRLIMGNHDIFKNEDYLKAGFEDLHAFRKFDGFACTHIPVHPDHLGRWGVNVHGHTHSNNVVEKSIKTLMPTSHYEKPDPRYICVCMEQLNDYTPVSLEEIRARIKP
jgi:calcineurin-like phosphoesterase family protein